MSNKIKVVVFDFDGTLYSGKIIGDVRDYFYNGIVSILSTILSAKELKNIDNAIKQNSESDRLAIRFLKHFGKNQFDWFNYKDSHDFSYFDFSKCVTINDDVLKEFAKNHKLYVVSNSTKKSIYTKCKLMNINPNYFEDILVNKFEGDNDSKEILYKEILEKEKISPNKMLVIGDDYEVDILPALEIGAYAVLIKNSQFKYKKIMTQIDNN